MKKTFATVCCLLLTGAFALTGCSTAPEQAVKLPSTEFDAPQYTWGTVSGQTLVIWGDASNLERPYCQRAFARYEQLTGNTIRLEKIPIKDMEPRLIASFGSTGPNEAEKPDILFYHGGTNLDRLRPDDHFYDFTKAAWVSDLTGMAINQTIYNGKVIGLPFSEASISGTIYNKELFKKYNLQEPRTQEEFMAVCETLLQNGITPVYLPYAEISMLLYQFPMDSIVQNSATLNSLNDGSLSYSQLPAMKNIISWYKTMSDRGFFGISYTANDWNGMDEAMRGENYAMMLCWDTWLYTNFSGDASKFGLMPAFMGGPEKGSFEGPNLTLLIANKNSPRLQATLDFIEFMADPYNYNVAFEGIYTAPIFKNQIGSLSTPQYQTSERLIERHFLDSTAWLRIKGFSQLDASYIQKHMLDDSYSAQDCLEDMDWARKERAAMQSN